VHGLALKLRQSLLEKKIRDLNATYLTLSLGEISQKTKSEPEILEGVVSGMIAKGTISAKINCKQQTVDFLEEEEI